MERIVVATGNYPLCNNDMREVNNYLANGWTVKSVTPQNTKDHMTVIFVLESPQGTIKNNHPFAGKYKTNPLVDYRIDYIQLDPNGTFEWSIHGGGTGNWTSIDNTITLVPNNSNSTYTFNMDACEGNYCIIVHGRCFTKVY